MDYPATIGVGLIGGGVMTAVLYMGVAMMPSQMKMDLLYLLGSMMLPHRVMAYGMGGLLHGGLSVAFALAHVGIYRALEIETNLAAWGVLFGFAHFLVAGMALGMKPVAHPRIRSGESAAPGPFATGYPAGTVMGFLMLHLLFGVLVAVFYDVLSGV